MGWWKFRIGNIGAMSNKITINKWEVNKSSRIEGKCHLSPNSLGRNMILIIGRGPSLYYVRKRLGSKNGQFCWRSVFNLCWHSGSVGGSEKVQKICWRNIGMVPRTHLEILYFVIKNISITRPIWSEIESKLID